MVEEESKYAYKKKPAWELLSKDQIKEVFNLAEEYKKFLDSSKTERETIQKIKENATRFNKKILLNRESEAAIIVTGKKPVGEGLRIVISHIDSPRLDLKQVPLYEDSDSNLALFETHYYGGIKNFQWVTIPLACTVLL